MTTKSRERIYGAAIRASAERAKQARKEADKLACAAWNRARSATRGRPSRLLRSATLDAYLAFATVTGCANRNRLRADQAVPKI
jgi:hypothetical protein